MNNNPSIEFLDKDLYLDCSETESIEVYVPPESQAHSPLSRRSEMSPVSYESIVICKDIDFEDELNKAQHDEEEDAFKILSISFYDRKQSFKSINLMSCDHSPKKSEDSDLTPGKSQSLLANSKRENKPNPQQKYFQYYNLTSTNKPKTKVSAATTATTSYQNLGPKPSTPLFSIRESLNNVPLMHYEMNPEVTIQTERGSRIKRVFEERANTENNSMNLTKQLSLSPRLKYEKLPSPQTPEKQNSIKPLGTEMLIKEKVLFRRTLFQDLSSSSSTSKEMTKSALSDRNMRNSPRGLVTKLKLDEGYRTSRPESTKNKTNANFRKPENPQGPTPPSMSRNALLQIIEAKRATLSHIDSSKVQVFSEPNDYYFNTETLSPRKQEKTKPVLQLRKIDSKPETKSKVPWKRLTPRESNQDTIKFSPRNQQESSNKGKIDFKQKNLESFKLISSPQNGKISKGLTNIKNVAILKKKV